MPTDQITCPQCNKVFLNFAVSIEKVHGKNYLQYCCPDCAYVFWQRKSWSQTARVLAIIFFIPSAMFLIVAATVVFSDNSFPILPSYIFFPAIVLIFLFFHFFVQRLIKKERPINILGKDLDKYKAKPVIGQESREEEIVYEPSSDPLMDKIRLDSIELLKKNQSEEKVKKPLLMHIVRLALVVIIVLAGAASVIPQFLELLKEYETGNQEMREMIIDSRADSILIVLRNFRNKYPQVLPQNLVTDIFKEDDDKIDMEYFGETIGPEDFVYTSTGDSFHLCIKETLGGKCWSK